MYQVQNFTTDAKQKLTVQLADGSSFLLRISYSDTMKGWFIVELTYGSLTINMLRLVNSPNLLRQFRNLLPFGLFVTTPGSREMMLISDLASNTTQIYVMTAAEVASYEAYISGK